MNLHYVLSELIGEEMFYKVDSRDGKYCHMLVDLKVKCSNTSTITQHKIFFTFWPQV